MKILILYGVTCMALAGCAGVKVTKPSADDLKKTGPIEGIPFYIKVAQCVHETRWMDRQLIANVAFAEDGSGKADNDKWNLVIQDSPEAIQRLSNELRTANPKDRSEAAAAIVKARQALGAAKLLDPARDDKPVSNAWETKMIVGSEVYYVTSHAPLFGSANTTFKFGDDGTMTEATSNLTDDTAKSLLGLLPIADKLAIQWGTKAPPTAPVNTAMFSPASRMEIGLSLPKPTQQDARRFDLSFKPLQTIVTMRQVSTTSEQYAASICSIAKQPSYLRENDGGVQVVSQETVGEGAKKDTEETGAYKINGSITPPKGK